MSRLKLMLLFMLLFSFVLLSTQAATAAPSCTTICFVDAVNGDDTNDGTTAATALKTIQAGVNQVSTGGTVNVAPGQYPENVTISKSLTLTGAGDGTNAAEDTILEGTGRTGRGIFINSNVTDVTIENLRVQNYKMTNGTGIWANGGNNNFTVQNVTVFDNGVAGTSGGGVYMNGPVDDVLIDSVTAHNNRMRGIVIWNGFKTNITITNNDVQLNNCCGIELQDGTASGVTITGNTVKNNIDNGIGVTGLMVGAGPNLIADNTLEDNGRFGIEIKLPNGTGLDSGDGSIVVEDNEVSLTTLPTDLRDYVGIAAFRRGFLASENNVDIPTGVIIRDNTVSGYRQTNGGSFSTGFGIVVEGTNMHVENNTLNNNDVGVQVQAGHTPYVANTNTDGIQDNVDDDYFGRGNSPIGCATIGENFFNSNGVDFRTVGPTGGPVANVDTGEHFCSIQAAINDSDTVNGHTIEVGPGTFTEAVTVNKSLTINGANAGVSPNDPVGLLDPNPARGPESEMAVTGGNRAFSISAANVTIDGFKFTDSAVAQANVQSPIIGAGANYGDDAPGVKIINNLFYETSRTVVYFNGPTQMQGGTVDNNRVESPGRPDTGCDGATAPSNCGHQLFNLWKTDNVSFQWNVTRAESGNRDRMRLLNISDSTNVLIAGNVVRYTCVFTCISIPNAATDVEVRNNDIETDAGQALAIHSSWTNGSINVHHNYLTSSGDYPIAIDNLTADLDNVHINRNAIFGAGHIRNGNDTFTTPGAETLDATCNWWGNAAGPNPANFFGPSEFTPWLKSDNLDGPCVDTVYVSAEKAGSVAGAGAFGVEDILAYDGGTDSWSLFFDGSSEGLTKKHNINGMQINAADDLYLTFFQNKSNVPGIPGKVTGHDIIHYDGDVFSLYFDGSAVGLTTTAEKLDGISILDGMESPIGTDCNAYLLVSTIGVGRVPNHSGGTLKFQGEDILGFCLFTSGASTTGLWHLAFDGSAEGMPKNSTYGLSTDAGVDDFYFITKAKFNVDGASGNHSQIYHYDGDDFTGPIFSAPDEGLNRKVNAIDVASAD